MEALVISPLHIDVVTFILLFSFAFFIFFIGYFFEVMAQLYKCYHLVDPPIIEVSSRHSTQNVLKVKSGCWIFYTVYKT